MKPESPGPGVEAKLEEEEEEAEEDDDDDDEDPVVTPAARVMASLVG